MKRNRAAILLMLCIVAFLCPACGDEDGKATGSILQSSSEAAGSMLPSSSEAEAPESLTMDVMYVPLGEDGALYFTQNKGTGEALTLRLPEDLRDENGDAIARSDLERGNVIRLHFSKGYYIAMSWPGQLMGEADYGQIINRGKPEDADKYQEAVDTFYHPDILVIPALQFTYIDDISACGGSLSAETGAYQWECTDEAGQPRQLSREADHPLLRDDLPQISMPGNLPLELMLDKDALQWEVRRWPVSEKGNESLPEGEQVTPTPGAITTYGVDPDKADTGPALRAVIEDAGPGFIYQVSTEWEQGTITYSFEIVSR